MNLDDLHFALSRTHSEHPFPLEAQVKSAIGRNNYEMLFPPCERCIPFESWPCERCRPAQSTMAYWNDWNQHRFEPSIALSPASRPSTATWISRGHREGGDDWKSTDHIDACEFHHLPKRSEAYRDVRVGVNDGGDFQHIQLDQGQDSRSARLRVAAVRWAPEIAWLVVGYLCLVGTKAPRNRCPPPSAPLAAQALTQASCHHIDGVV